MLRFGILAGLVLSVVPSVTFAAPANLTNKTITVSTTTTAPWITTSGKTGVGPGRMTTTTIYISSAGRIFARRLRRDGGGATEDMKFAPVEHDWRFVGNKLIVNAGYVSGASLLTISFDPSGQSCTASVQFGRDAGRAMVWKGADGVTYTSTGPWVASNVTCSIASGNAFAGQ